MFFKILIAFFCAIICTEARDIGRIVGGSHIEHSVAPYIASLQSWYFQTHHCGCSIIGEGKGGVTWAITAAHCADDPTRKPFIRVGTAYSESGGTTFNVTEIIVHPLFTRSVMDYDVALLKLDGKVTKAHGAVKINLPEEYETVTNGMPVRVSGWGHTKNEKESRDKLRSVEIEIRDFKQCKENYTKISYEVTDRMFCASRPGKDACQMDSGGPLVYQNQKLVGLVSWGDECGSPSYPGVYTYVSKVREWIRDNCGI